MKESVFSIIFFCSLVFGSLGLAADDTQESSFKSCREKNVKVNLGKGAGHCLQPAADDFLELRKIVDATKIADFQIRLKNAVRTKLDYKVFESKLLQACAKNDVAWFKSRKLDESKIEAFCKPRMDNIRKSIRLRFPIMRRELALSKPRLREDQFIADRGTWITREISHGLFSNFNKPKPLSEKEAQDASEIYAEEIATEIVRRNKGMRNGMLLRSEGTTYFVNDIIRKAKIRDSKATKKEIMKNYLLKTKSYGISGFRGYQDQIHKKHEKKYFEMLNQMPLMGFIDEVDLRNENSPTNEQIAHALSKTGGMLSAYQDKLLKNKDDDVWVEYAKFIPEIENILKYFPEYCGIAETLLKHRDGIERGKLYRDLAIAGIAAVPCFIGGPVTAGICVAGGTAIGAKGIYDANTAYDDTLAVNLTDFLGKDGFANFQKLDAKKKDLVLQSFLLPMGAFGATWKVGDKGVKAVRGTVTAYDDAGRFISKQEGLEIANKALERFLQKHPNFKDYPVEKQQRLFDKLLADEFLPKHLLSFLENKKGGYKLIDTNYDLDSLPDELLEKVAAKLGSKDEAIKFVKNMYHRHVLDHHGTMGNMANATQQSIKKVVDTIQEIKLKYADNPAAMKAAIALATRQLKKEFYRVGTDNLGDGQLATYLTRHKMEELIKKPAFAKLMHKVADIEDFGAFGPELYLKFATYKDKIANGMLLLKEELAEFQAMKIALARQKAINDLLLKYGTDESLGGARMGLLFADRFNGLPPEVQKKIVAELDELTTKILADDKLAGSMANDYVTQVNRLAGTAKNPGLVRQAEVAAAKSYKGIAEKALQAAKDEIFAFDATKLRNLYQEKTGKVLGPFEVFHAPQPVLNAKKKVLVSINDTGDKRTFVVAFGNGLRKGKDTLKAIAKEIHLVEKRTLEKLIATTKDPNKLEELTKELEAVKGALDKPEGMGQFGGPASLMRSAADDKSIRDLVFNFAGVRSSQADILEAVIRGRAQRAN